MPSLRRRPLHPAALFLALSCASAVAAVPSAHAISQGPTPSPEIPKPVPVEAAVPPGAIARVEVIGAHGLKPETVAAAATRAVRGRPANDPRVVHDAAEAVRGLYRSHGFTLAQVIASEVTPQGTLRLTVAEGTIHRIVVRGNTKTQTRIVRATLGLQSGDVYREGDIKEARNRLARLGIFDDVLVAPSLDADKDAADPGSDKNNTDKPKDTAPPAPDPIGQGKPAPDAAAGAGTPPTAGSATAPIPEPPVQADEVGFIDLVVRVKERKTGNVALTVGYADGSGLTGFVDLSEDNFNGTAQRVSGQWQRFNQGRLTSDGELLDEGTRSAYGVSFEQPFLGPRSTSYSAELYDKNTIFQPFFFSNQDTIRNYELRRGGRVRVGKSFSGGRYSMFLSARHDQVGYDPVPEQLNPPINALSTSDATVAALGLTLLADGRDAADSPRRGYLRSVSYERSARAFGASRDFGQVTMDLRQYTALNGKPTGPVLALRAMGGTSTGSVPLSEQFWLGGYDLLRGYDLYSIRGDRMLLLSAEGRMPLGPGIQGALFTDYGNAWVPGSKVEVGSMKASVGAGLRFLTPIGPIRFDVAYGSRVQTYVSLGQSY